MQRKSLFCFFLVISVRMFSSTSFFDGGVGGLEGFPGEGGCGVDVDHGVADEPFGDFDG
ncbi:hypothetical protein [Rhodococcus sp. LB1]|uniref:hypothetical protein n=1 Tax=Rhodococcus sp. LB1 TaxID=1807499 RepID=UPI0012E88980|nr:hypothetical protein [Rhodococcus sp. LB1]MDI9940645.1 hypothetical protein [Rhodococcus sp. IEGM 1351]